ncbi:MAG: hypothetical protein JWR21_3272 [Herminiimonas sp.]|nr:hypothetical protein [Herminiimonas sp.]
MRICARLGRLRGKIYGATGIASSGNIRPPFFGSPPARKLRTGK